MPTRIVLCYRLLILRLARVNIANPLNKQQRLTSVRSFFRKTRREFLSKIGVIKKRFFLSFFFSVFLVFFSDFDLFSFDIFEFLLIVTLVCEANSNNNTFLMRGWFAEFFTSGFYTFFQTYRICPVERCRLLGGWVGAWLLGLGASFDCWWVWCLWFWF